MLQICTTECNPFGSMLSNVSQYFSDGVRLPKRRGIWLESRWDSLKCFNLRAHKHNLLTVHALSARFYFWSSYTHSDHFSLWRWNYLWRYFRKHWKLISSSSSSPLPSSSHFRAAPCGCIMTVSSLTAPNNEIKLGTSPGVFPCPYLLPLQAVMCLLYIRWQCWDDPGTYMI